MFDQHAKDDNEGNSSASVTTRLVHWCHSILILLTSVQQAKNMYFTLIFYITPYSNVELTLAQCIISFHNISNPLHLRLSFLLVLHLWIISLLYYRSTKNVSQIVSFQNLCRNFKRNQWGNNVLFLYSI